MMVSSIDPEGMTALIIINWVRNRATANIMMKDLIQLITSSTNADLLASRLSSFSARPSVSAVLFSCPESFSEKDCPSIPVPSCPFSSEKALTSSDCRDVSDRMSSGVSLNVKSSM